MSLDLNGRAGLSFNSVALAAADLTGVTAATFDAGAGEDGATFALYVSTATGAVDASTMPASLTRTDGAPLFEDGMSLVVIKASTDNNRITWTEPAGTPLAGVSVGFVNRQVERIQLEYDGAAGIWRFV